MAVAAGAALVASAFLTVIRVTAASASCEDLAGQAAARCHQTGLDRHSVAYLLFGLAAIGLGLVGWVRQTPLPFVLIAAVGVAALAIALGVDLPDSRRAGALGLQLTDAQAHPGGGLWVEIAGGALAAVAGAGGCLAARSRSG